MPLEQRKAAENAYLNKNGMYYGDTRFSLFKKDTMTGFNDRKKAPKSFQETQSFSYG